MKILNVKNIGGALLGSLMLLGTVMVSSTTTQAQYPYPNQDQYRRQRDYERKQFRLSCKGLLAIKKEVLAIRDSFVKRK